MTKNPTQNVRDTSIRAYHEIITTGQAMNEKKKVLKAYLEIGPATDRMIAKHTGIEKGNIPRCRKDLMDTAIVVYSGKDSCKITGRKARYHDINPNYRIKTNEGQPG